VEHGYDRHEARYGWLARQLGIEKLDCLIRDTGRRIMGRLDAIDTALNATSTGLDGVQSELAKLAGQIGEIQAGSVPQADIDALAAKASALADRVGGIKSDVDAAIEVPGEDDAAPGDGGDTPV
jgi:hypothetical protein